jgi:hypothetical protein
VILEELFESPEPIEFYRLRQITCLTPDKNVRHLLDAEAWVRYVGRGPYIKDLPYMDVFDFLWLLFIGHYLPPLISRIAPVR